MTKKTNVSKKRGRPSKYEKINLRQVEELAKLGLIEEEIATVLGISKATLTNYKRRPEFLASIKKGKLVADAEVTKSLYKRATGYDDEKAIYFSSYEGEVTQTPYVKHYAPDVTAQIFWLKNRRRQDWRDYRFDDGVDRQDEYAKVMAAYSKAFMDHPGQGMVSSGDHALQDESGEI